jgi:hypothetical protein
VSESQHPTEDTRPVATLADVLRTQVDVLVRVQRLEQLVLVRGPALSVKLRAAAFAAGGALGSMLYELLRGLASHLGG